MRIILQSAKLIDVFPGQPLGSILNSTGWGEIGIVHSYTGSALAAPNGFVAQAHSLKEEHDEVLQPTTRILLWHRPSRQLHARLRRG